MLAEEDREVLTPGKLYEITINGLGFEPEGGGRPLAIGLERGLIVMYLGYVIKPGADYLGHGFLFGDKRIWLTYGWERQLAKFFRQIEL